MHPPPRPYLARVPTDQHHREALLERTYPLKRASAKLGARHERGVAWELALDGCEDGRTVGVERTIDDGDGQRSDGLGARRQRNADVLRGVGCLNSNLYN